MLKPKVRRASNKKPVLAALAYLRSNTVVVGIPRGSAKSARGQGKLTNAELALIHEFGTSRIPARPWIRPPIWALKQEWVTAFGEVWNKCADGKGDPEKMLNALGAKGAAAVKGYVTRGDSVPPPNAPSTIERKGSSRTLVDTGAMVQSVTWVVRKKKK